MNSDRVSAQRDPIAGDWLMPVWVRLTVVFGALLLTIGALLALLNPTLLVGNGQEMNAAARIFAGYLFSRNLAVATLLICALVLRTQKTLGSMILLTAAIQLIDAVVDTYEQRWMIAPGVAVLGCLFLIAAGRVLGGPVWSVRFWRSL